MTVSLVFTKLSTTLHSLFVIGFLKETQDQFNLLQGPNWPPFASRGLCTTKKEFLAWVGGVGLIRLSFGAS